MSMVKTGLISLDSNKRSHWVDITVNINEFLAESFVKDGVVTVSSLHTTAAITINENGDPDVGRDFFWKLDSLIEQDLGFKHAEGNSDSHLKTSLVGESVQVPVRNGRCQLGTWQSIYFCEFDGPRRNRTISLTFLG